MEKKTGCDYFVTKNEYNVTKAVCRKSKKGKIAPDKKYSLLMALYSLQFFGNNVLAAKKVQ